MSGWGKKERGAWHFYKPGHPRSACSQEYHMGQVEFHKSPPCGVKLCKKCTDLVGRPVSEGLEQENAALRALVGELTKELEDMVHQAKRVCGQCEQWIDWVDASEAIAKAKEVLG